MQPRDFERLLLEAVDEGLSSLGRSSRQSIYFHLEKNFNVKRHEIPCKIEIFADAMEKIFGSGASFLEILIMKRLKEKIGAISESGEPANFAFAEYVTLAKQSLLEKNRAKDLQWRR